MYSIYPSLAGGEGGGGDGVGDVTRVERVNKVKKEGHGLPSSASWAENTIMTECTQECGHLQSTVCTLCDMSLCFFTTDPSGECGQLLIAFEAYLNRPDLYQRWGAGSSSPLLT
jgi:hypothetical protein